MMDFNSQNLANTAWAFATVGHKDERLFSTLAAAAERRTMDFNSQNLANTAWAFATAGHKDERLFSTLAAAAEQRAALVRKGSCRVCCKPILTDELGLARRCILPFLVRVGLSRT